MRLTTRQKNIVNPFVETYASIIGEPGRRGVDYDYTNERNKWIIEGIHDCYLNYGYFPAIGTVLKNIGPISGEQLSSGIPDNVISREDAYAYAAVYPQNVIVTRSVFADSNEYNPDPAMAMQMISGAEGKEILIDLAKELMDNDKLELYTSKGTPEAQTRDNQILQSIADDIPIEEVEGERLDSILDLYPSKLISIPYISSQSRVVSIRNSFGNNVIGPLLSPPEPQLTLRETLVKNQSNSYDLSDWTNNVGPVSPGGMVVYFNPTDSNLYFLKRTTERNPAVFDIDYLSENDTPQRQTLINFKKEALQSMLELCGRYNSSEDIFNETLDLVFTDTHYGDTYRPAPPSGLGFWLLGARLTLAAIEAFPENLQPTNEILFPKTDPSPVTMAQALISIESTTNYFYYTKKHLAQKIIDINAVLGFYESKFEEQELSSETVVGFNIESTIARLNNFMEDMDNLFLINNRDIDSDDYIEFLLDSEFRPIIYGLNGDYFFKGVGRDIETLKPQLGEYSQTNLSPDRRMGKFYVGNLLENISPTVFGYIYKAADIQVFGRNLQIEEPPPWTEFFAKYTYPNPNKNSFKPGDISRHSAENSKLFEPDAKKTKDQAAAVRNSRVINTPEQLQKQNEKLLRLRKESVKRKQLYLLVNSSIGGCNSGAAQALKTGLKAYQLLDSKSRPRDWVNLAIGVLRTELVSEVIARNLQDLGAEEIEGEDIRQGLSQAEFYERNPEQLVKVAEKYVNDQLDACLGAVGQVVIQQIITPGNDPRYATKYWKKRVGKQNKVKIRKGFTRDFNRIWKKELQKMLTKYIEQLILSIVADIVQAALGCGPAIKSDEPMKKFPQNSGSYGIVQIGDLAIEQLGAESILVLAEQYGIINQIPSLDDSGEKTIETSPATLDQLKQFMKDTSDYLVAEEAVALLDNNANINTIASIYEMIYYGRYSLPNDDEIEVNLDDDELYLRQFQESLNPDDTRYATLNLTKEKISSFYGRIGELIDPDLDSIPPLDPAEAWCAQQNPESPGSLTDMGLSQAQAIRQMDQHIAAKVSKIQEKCEWLSIDFQLDTEINKFFSGIPFSGMYDSMLASIAEQSKELQKALRDALLGSARAGQSISAQLTEEDMELYIFAEQNYGDLRTLPQVRLTAGSTPEWFIGDESIGQVSFIFNKDSVNISQRSPEEFRNDEPKRVIANSLLVDDNIVTVNPPSNDEIDYPPEGVGEFSLINLANEVGEVNSNYSFNGTPISYPLMTGDMVDNINKAIVSGEALVPLGAETDSESTFMLLISNSGEEGFIKEQLKDFYLTPESTKKLRKFVELLSKPYFVHTGDVCNPTTQERIATAVFDGIQARIINFFLNTGALTRIYYYWNTPDILNILVEYLTTKIQRELASSGLLNVYLDGMNSITETFSRTTVEAGEIPFDLSNIIGLREKLKYTIQQSFKEIFKRYTKSRSLSAPIEGNLYYDNQRRFIHLMKFFKTNTFDYGENAPGGVHIEDVLGLAPLDNSPGINNLDLQEWATLVGQYYIPAPLIIAMQIIYYDSTIAVGDKFPAFRLDHRRRLAIADDNVLSAVNDSYISIFQQPYEGYPVVIAGNTYYSKEEILAEIDFLRNQRERVYNLESMFGPLALYEEDYVSRAYRWSVDEQGLPIYLPKELTGDADDPNFRDFFNPLYALARPGYDRLYPPGSADRYQIQKRAITYNYVSQYPSVFKDPTLNIADVDWAKQRAWYERARLLGAAGDDPLIDSYVDCEDINNRPEFGGEDNLDRPINSAEGNEDLTWRTYIETARLNMINESSFQPDEEVRSDTAIVLGAVGYGALAGLGAAAFYGTFAVIGYLSGAAASVVIAPAVAAAAVVAVVVGIWTAISEIGTYYDPNRADCSRRILPTAPPITIDTPDGTRATFDPFVLMKPGNAESPWGPADDFIAAASVLEGQGTTIDKAAMAYLYYTLAWTSLRIKPRFDIQNPNNELDQLLEHLDADEEPDTGFPIYIQYNSARGDADSIKVRAFNSISDLERGILDLQQQPVYLESEDWNRRQIAITENRAERIRLLDEAENKYGRFLEEAINLFGADQELEGIRTAIGGGILNRSFTSFVDEYRYEYAPPNYLDWFGIGYRDRRFNEYEDIWSAVGRGGLAAGDLISPDPPRVTTDLVKQIGYITVGTRNPIAGTDDHGPQPPGIVSSMEHIAQIQGIYSNLPEDIDLSEENYKDRLDKIEADITQLQQKLTEITNLGE
jgi:hypothetical protein